MKRLLLLFAGLLIGLTTVSATEINHHKTENKFDKKNRYRYAQPIIFLERGVEFLIFPDGSFDFNTNPVYNNYHDYYRQGRSKNRTYGASGRYPQSNWHPNKRVSISHDRDGKVRRIGNVYLNYDRFGKIKRAGSVYMNYNRGYHATLRQVGGLHVKYNRWGEIVNMRGRVNRFSNFCDSYNIQSRDRRFNNEYWDRDNDWYDEFDDDVYDNDDNYYYFKQNGKVKKHKKRKD